MTDSDSPFRVAVEVGGPGTVMLALSGELDMASMPVFDAHLATPIVQQAVEIIFDITATQFISAEGYRRIGQCSLSKKNVVVRCRTSFASKVLAACGYDRPVCVIAPELTSNLQ